MSMAAGTARRLDIGKVLSDGLGAAARNFGPFFLLALLLQGVPSALLTYGQLMAKANAGFGIFAILGGAATLVTVPMLQGALIYGTMRDLDGRPASITECMTVGRRHWLMLLGLAILSTLAVGLGLVLLIVPGVLLALRWAVAGPLVVLEGRGIQEAMGRSADLTRDRRWSIFLLGLIFLGLLMVVEFALTAVGAVFYGLANSSQVSTLLSPAVNMCTSLLVYPIATALFRELRGDQEGGDPEVLAEVFA